MILTERELELNRISHEKLMSWASKVKAGDMLHPTQAWNLSGRSRRLPSKVRVISVARGNSHSGLAFEITFVDGFTTFLDASWFGGVVA